MCLPRRNVFSVLASIAIIAALASCGSLISFESEAPPAEERSQPTADGDEVSQPTEEPADNASGQSSDGSGEEVSQAAEETSEAAPDEGSGASAGDLGGMVGDLIMIEDDGYTYTLTFVDTQTGDSDSRYFALPDEGEINPAGTRGLPFDEDFTKLAVVSEWRDGEYYRSAGYVAADGGYVEETAAETSFEGESGFYAAAFDEGELWVMSRNYEWVEVSSGEVRGESPKVGGNESEYTEMYIGGAGSPAEYGLGYCWDWDTFPSRTTSRCYESSYDGNIDFFSNETMIVGGESETIVNGACDSLLALDGEDDFYCVDELEEGRRLVRIENGGGGEAIEITPGTDQEILQAIVSESGEEVLFTARRDDDPIEAYVVPSEGGSEPRVKPALTGFLSNEDQKFYRWAPK